MTAKQARLTVAVVFGLVILVRTLYPAVDHKEAWDTAIGICIELVGGIVLLGILNVLQNIRQLKLLIQTRVLLRNTEVRLSIAYLYRIKVGDQYLLVKNRSRNYFQPVGGVFKTLPGSEKIFEELGVRPDRLIQTEQGIAKNDLRLHVLGKNVIDFFSWFDSKQDRETSPWREFCEELLTTQILPQREFRYIDYRYKGTVRTPIITLDSGGKGMFMYEVYDLVINDEQRLHLEALRAKGDQPSHIWADRYLIDRLGHDERSKTQVHEIAPHTKWAYDLHWSAR